MNYTSTDFSQPYEKVKSSFELKVPDNFNFTRDVLDVYAACDPDRLALVWCNDYDEEKRFTFFQMSQCVNRTANFLVSHGIKKGQAVMLMLRRRYEFWFFILALHKIGAVAVPATHQLLENDIRFRVEAANVKMIVCLDEEQPLCEIEKACGGSEVCGGALKVIASGKRKDWICFEEEFENQSVKFIPQADCGTSNSDPMLLYFTSGTSGSPKMVCHDFTYPLGHIVTAKYWQGVVDGGLHMTVAETGWAKAVWGKLYGAWLCGCAVFVFDMKLFFPERLLEKLQQYKVTSFCAPPTMYRLLGLQNLKKYDLSNLKHACVAGEALSDEVYNSFVNQTGIELHEGYGQTETVLLAASFGDEKVRRPSMGKPNPMFDLHVVDENGVDCGPGVTGEIVLHLKEKKYPGLFEGYYNDASLTEAAFKDGIYHTNDLARVDEDGFIYFEGRKDDVIKSSGFRVSPYEIESVLLEHDAVLECGVTGVPDPKRGQKIKAFVVLKENYSPNMLTLESIKFFLHMKLALYKQPREIVFTDSLPKTISGKIKRRELRSWNPEKLNVLI